MAMVASVGLNVLVARLVFLVQVDAQVFQSMEDAHS